MSSSLIAQIDELTASILPDLIEIRHDLHAHPQRGFEETYAAEVVQREMEAADVPFKAAVARTGVVGWLAPPGGPSGDAIALRADMDALPIVEQTGLPYASTFDGCMHACGHDGHMAVLIGTARVLSRLRDALPQPVKLIFQPAEEGRGGAREVIADGALDETVGGVKVGMIFGLHGWPSLESGTVATREGAVMARADSFRITVRGRGGHGAMPQTAADPVLAAAHVVTAIQSIVARNVDPADAAVITVGRFQAGTAVNIIPESAELAGTIRSLDDETAGLLHTRLADIARQIAGGLGCSADVHVESEYPVTANDAAATRRLMRAAAAVLGRRNTRALEKPEMGSEDFSCYCQRVPGCLFFLGVRPKGRSACPSLHSPEFDFRDEAITPGVRVMAGLALGLGQRGKA
ncbi:MAG TPA: amidohydrolase [Phycisphaerae bacterium]|nr:amidohydrolase [Phycisphaerae bacterium]HUT61745.1 amidohydrolase [Phycisphaerae bacterium]